MESRRHLDTLSMALTEANTAVHAYLKSINALLIILIDYPDYGTLFTHLTSPHPPQKIKFKFFWPHFLMHFQSCTFHFSLIKKTKKLKGPPLAKNMAFIDKTNLKLQHADSKKKKDIILKTGLKGECCLRQLSFHDRYLHTPAEPMHLIKNIVEHIVKLISGGWKPKALFSVKFIGMKSHSWKQLVSTNNYFEVLLKRFAWESTKAKFVFVL